MLKRGMLHLSEKTKNILAILCKIALIEIGCEALIMYLLLPPLEAYLSSSMLDLVDPLLLAVMTAPLIAFFVINPFIVSETHLINKLKHASTRDSLTGLYNRGVLNDALNQILSEFNQNSDQGYALLLIDLDKFKQVNDTLGHNAGDELLINMAARLHAVCNETDLICRIGGDEFAIIHTYPRGAPGYTQLAKRITNSMSDHFTLSGVRYSAGLSIGYTEVSSKHKTAVSILCDADIALYQAKIDSVVRIKQFDSRMKDATDKLFKISQDIKNSITNNELSVHYQPIVDIFSKKMIGAEALLRWHHPLYGEVVPDFFIPIAESNGFICDLFKFLLSSVCQLHKELANSMDDGFYISINISGSQFKYSNIQDDFYSTIKSYDLKPHQFRLELTESSFIDYQSHISGSLSDMVNKGFLFFLDDFGTGFSSISSLYQLPFSAIKIDRFCVRDINKDPYSRRLFDGIVNLTRTVDIPVIVEGIETVDQHDYIKSLNLHFAQGFYYSKPLSVEDFHQFIADTILLGKASQKKIF
ncbi:MAG: EAL domain-containing protein [Gammaproteobacteria bacterium]|nr:EAL domain-containing protein [Gammaproteobacteria bacterium]